MKLCIQTRIHEKFTAMELLREETHVLKQAMMQELLTYRTRLV